MKNLLLFDFDGVLCDSLDCAIECTRIAVEELGLPAVPVSAEAIAELRSVTFPEIGRLAGVPESRQSEFGIAIFSALKNSAASCRTFAEIPEAIRTLSSSATVGVVTANHPDVVQSVLRRADIESCVSATLGGDIPGHKAEKIKRLMEQFNVSAEHTWMIGDSRSDILEGKKAGVLTLGVSWGWQPRNALLELAPTAIADTIFQMVGVLTNHNSQMVDD